MRDKKRLVKIGLIVVVSFCIAYFIDQYYIEKKGSMFLFQLFKL